MKRQTWIKIGELILDYSKILFGVGMVSPFINEINLDYISIYGIIITIVILMITGLITYNKGVKDE